MLLLPENQYSPVISDVSSGEYCILYDTVSNDNCELPLVTESDSINSLLRNNVSNEYCQNKNANPYEVSKVLKQIRKFK